MSNKKNPSKDISIFDDNSNQSFLSQFNMRQHGLAKSKQVAPFS